VSTVSRLAALAMSLPRPLDTAIIVERGVRVPMDDGVALLADIYTPGANGPHPTVLARSPYGRGGPLGLFLGRIFAERGYRVVMQSCRGTFGSGGEFDPNFNERADGLATIRWIEQQPWFDGRLATNGPSYLGGVQWAVADDAGPALRAMCTHVAYSNVSRHWFAGGSLSLEDAIDWTTMVGTQEQRFAGIKTLSGERLRRLDRVINTLPIIDLDERLVGKRVPYWRDIVEHPSIDDPFWQPIDHSSRVAAVVAPVLQVGGWYDIFLPVQLDDYRALAAAGNQPRLVIGPWTHIAPKGFATQLTESLRWLDRHVRRVGSGDAVDVARPVRVFVMGAEQWRDFSSWPPAGYEAQRWHLQPDGGLEPAEPAESEPDTYRYDPADPTPIAGGTLLRRTGGRRNQSATEGRADVIVFTSKVLATDIEVIGEISAEIHVSSDLDHFDVFVRLCDVDEKGRSRNVCDGLERVSPTRAFARATDGTWAIRVALWPTAQRFRAGHRIRVQVASGAHPRFARNLGTGEPPATATTMRVAHQAIHHDPRHPSAIVLPVKAG
jgi:putative CocE/NonD family hydrolase